MKKRNAFTLIELLAVIVILAVILVIAIPRILDVIETSKKDSFKSTAQLIADSAEKKYVTNKLNNIDEEITCDKVAKISSKDYEYCFVKINEEGKATVTIEGKGKFKGMGICNASKETSEISDTCSTDSSYFNYQEVEDGILIRGSSIIPKVTVKDESKCKNYLINSWNNDSEEAQSDATTLCSGNALDDGLTLKGAIQAGFIPSKDYEEAGLEVTIKPFNKIVNVIIPGSINDKKVVAIGGFAFDSKQLISVVIPNTVTSIGNSAFSNNKLTTVTIPNSVISIGESAFWGNQLTSVTIPNSVKNIGDYAFGKSNSSNPNLIKIINETDNAFDWRKIVNYGSGYKFKGGIIKDYYYLGDVEVVYKNATKPTYGMKATEYITNLLEYDGEGLKIDNTEDENIRYYGSNPNNYVKFNNELWRIIGVFGDNVKLIRKDSLGDLSWDSSESSVNNGYGVNEWSQADLKNYLNTMYYGGTTVTCYGRYNNGTKTCPTNTLDETSKSLIDNHIWNTGAIEYNTRTDTLAFYSAERGNETGKICTGGQWCNDTVTRTTEWTGYIGLPYVTDWAYASSESVCETNMQKKDSSNLLVCKNNNWMQRNTWAWYLSPSADGSYANYAWAVSGDGYASNYSAANSLVVVPSIYLKSNVLIESGNGTSSNPYILKAGS